MKRLQVHKDAIIHNIARIRQMTRGTVWAVIKNDGYGMGLMFMAQTLWEAGVRHWAVSEPADIVRLRQAGYAEAEILCLRSTGIREEAETVLRMRAIATVGSTESARVLAEATKVTGERARVHIKVDTGMGRYGFLPVQTGEMIRIYRSMLALRAEGIYTHFACAANIAETMRQTARFRCVLDDLRRAGIDPGMTHASSSTALFRVGDLGMDAVRVGSALVGRASCADAGLLHAEELVCPVTEVREIPRGWHVGYGGAYRARQAMRVAVVPVGTWDGLARGPMRRGLDTLRFWRTWLGECVRRQGMEPVMARVDERHCPVIGRIGSGHAVLAVGDACVVPGTEVFFPVDPLQVNGSLWREYVE